MLKKLLTTALLVISLMANAQKTLDIESNVYLNSLDSPIVEKTVTATETGYVAKKAAYDSGLISEDKIWKYQDDSVEQDDNLCSKVNLKFSGTTNIDGVDYFNCYVWNADNEFDINTATLIAYIREDNGKVYTRYIPDAIYLAYTNNGIDLMAYSPVMDTMVDDINVVSQSDVLVYDNSLKIDDTFYTLPKENQYTHKMHVADLSVLECSDMSYNVWKINDESVISHVYEYYENIGDIHGLLPYPSPISYHYHAHTWNLIEVVDNEGNTIFQTSNIGTSTVSDLLYNDHSTPRYYTLDGKVITRPSQPGIYIKKTNSNGVISTEKIFVR